MLIALAGGLWWLDPPLSRSALSTGIGEVRTTTLSDGSRITLNTSSRIEAVIRLRSRETTLSSGEVLFEVSPSPTRPFQVVAGNTHVHVVGTTFNVRHTDNGVRVTVIEGKVAVQAAANQEVTLAKGEELEAAGGNIAVARVKNLDSIAAWNEGRLVFDDVPLSQALAEAQRYRRSQIVLSDTIAGRMRITGAFPTNDPDRLLKLLPEVFPVEVDFQADGTARILSRKSKPPEPEVNREFRAPTLLTPPSN
jgi:transmembrane sensor